METTVSSRHGTIVLIPKPSNDPRDPLVSQSIIRWQLNPLVSSPIRIVREQGTS